MASDDIITIKEVAAYLKLAEKTVYRLAADEELPAFKIGGSWRFRKAEIDKWISHKMKKDGKGQPAAEGGMHKNEK